MIFSALTIEVWTLCLDLTSPSHYSFSLLLRFCCASPSQFCFWLLLDICYTSPSQFCFQMSFLFVSTESHTQHRTASHVRFKCVRYCHQICFVSVSCCCMQDSSASFPPRRAQTSISASRATFFPVLVWMPMLLQNDCRHGS